MDVSQFKIIECQQPINNTDISLWEVNIDKILTSLMLQLTLFIPSNPYFIDITFVYTKYIFLLSHLECQPECLGLEEV